MTFDLRGGKNESFVWKWSRLARVSKIHEKTLVKKFLYTATPFWVFPTVQVDFYLQMKMEVGKRKGNWDEIAADSLDTVHSHLHKWIYRTQKTKRTVFSFCISNLKKNVGIRMSKDLSDL